MFYAVLAEVVCIAKLTNKYVLLKYNCTAKSLVAVAISSYTTRVHRITVKYATKVRRMIVNYPTSSEPI